MHIRQVQLATRAPRAVAAFYGQLGCPVSEEGGAVLVSAGRTTLVFAELDGMTGAHHLAFTVPTGTFDAARSWVAERAEVLRAPDGRDEFEGPAGWNSRSVYFEGPDQQLLELIERRDLPAEPHGGLPGTVSEVGVAVPDVLGVVDALGHHGVLPYGGPPTAGFAPVGDVHGLLVLVSPERRWFPTLDRVASTAPVVVDIGLGVAVEPAPGVRLR